MKKILYTFVISSMLLFYTTAVNASNEAYYTNREGIEMTEEQYNNLLELGFTEKQIYRMDYATFEDNKDIEATLLAEQTKYFKDITTIRNGIEIHATQELTEEETQEELAKKSQNNRDVYGNFYDGASAVTYRAVVSRIAYINDDNMRYKNDTYWLEMPSTKSYDIMGIGIEADKVQVGSVIVFREDWNLTNGNDGYSTTCYPKYESTGAGVLFPLPNSGTLSSLDMYAYITVTKKSGVGTITSLIATADYSHAFSNVTDDAYNYFSVNYIGGVVVTGPYAAIYDDITPAQASFVGSW